MHNVINKTEDYFMIDLYDNKTYYIGKKEDLLRFIARKFKTYHYLDSSRWSNEIFEDLNMNFNDSKTLSTYDFENSKYNYYIRRYLFYDGEKRIIDIRNFYEEIIKNFKELSEYNEIFEILKRHKEKYKKKQHRKHHSGNAFKGKMPKIRRTKVLNNNPEMKEFVRQRDKEFPDWWDDTNRRISCCWKDQYKTPKQWGHKKHSNFNNISIKSLQIEDEFNMEELLLEDFLSNKNIG